MWNESEIKNHCKSSEILNKIKDETFDYIKNSPGISEKEVQEFILNKFGENNLISDEDPPIVAFNENCSLPHYFPGKDSKKLKEGTLILMDIWGKLDEEDSPFADMTWMAYCGDEVPDKIQNVFDVVCEARNLSIDFLKNKISKNELPTGKEIDEVVRSHIENSGFKDKFLHGTGHSLGFQELNENTKHINSSGDEEIKLNQGYTIEPGIYLEKKFGIRSEIDFYISARKELVVTTKIQNKIVLLQP